MGDFSLKISNNSSERKKISLFQLGSTSESSPQNLLSVSNEDATIPVDNVGGVLNYVGEALPPDETYYVVSPEEIFINNTNVQTDIDYVSPNGATLDTQNLFLGAMNFTDYLSNIIVFFPIINTNNGYIGLSQSNINIDVTCKLKNDGGGNYTLKPEIYITYNGIPLNDLKEEFNSNILVVVKFTIYNNVSLNSYDVNFPYNETENIALGTSTYNFGYKSANGLQISDLNSGVSYQDILNSQNGNCYSINALRLQTYDSLGFIGDEKITQLLNPISFSKKNSNGNDKIINVTTTVDPFQIQDSLRNITLGENSNEYVLDGSVSMNYDLEPYATVSIEITYTKLPNFVFGNAVDIQRITELNRQQQAKEEELSNQAKTIQLEFEQGQEVVKNNINEIVNKAKQKDIKDFVFIGVVSLLIYKALK